MYRFIMLLAAVMLLSGCASTAAELAAIDPQTLCVDYAQAVITGRSVPVGHFGDASSDQIFQALNARGVTCVPMSRYFRLAAARLEIQQQNAANSAATLRVAAKLLKDSGPQPYPP
jgi:hypothetical protein